MTAVTRPSGNLCLLVRSGQLRGNGVGTLFTISSQLYTHTHSRFVLSFFLCCLYCSNNGHPKDAEIKEIKKYQKKKWRNFFFLCVGVKKKTQNWRDTHTHYVAQLHTHATTTISKMATKKKKYTYTKSYFFFLLQKGQVL